MGLSGVDYALLGWVVSHRSPWLDHMMLALTAIGGGGLVWLITGFGLVIAGRLRWRDLAKIVLTVVVTTLMADFLIKPLFHRPRPFLVWTAFPVIGHRPHDFSFPSGHAADGFAAALVLLRTVPGGWLVWAFLAVAIAYSRLYLGVHYPSDIAGSLLIGVACAALVTSVSDRNRKPR